MRRHVCFHLQREVEIKFLAIRGLLCLPSDKVLSANQPQVGLALGCKDPYFAFLSLQLSSDESQERDNLKSIKQGLKDSPMLHHVAFVKVQCPLSTSSSDAASSNERSLTLPVGLPWKPRVDWLQTGNRCGFAKGGPTPTAWGPNSGTSNQPERVGRLPCVCNY